MDTDVPIEIFDRNSKRGDEALKKIERMGEDITTTSLNLHAILYGLHKYTDHAKLEGILVLDVTLSVHDSKTIEFFCTLCGEM